MSVLVTTVIPQLNAEIYDGITAQAAPVLTAAKGFEHHVAYPGEGGWTVVEVWADADSFFAYYDEYIRPNLPEGTSPQVTELHNTLAPAV